MKRRLPFIPQRRPIFIGCEGDSEQGYAGLLQDCIREAGLPVHLVIDVLGPGTGDPLSRVEMAVRRLGLLRRTRTAPAERFVFLDSDQAERDPVRADRARRLAADNDIQIIWQEPCFEAVLLRHLPRRAQNRPVDSRTAQQALAREWPEYEKPMSRRQLGARIDLAAVLQACEVEFSLKQLLICIGLIPNDIP